MNEVEKYFNAEKIFCLFGALFGLASLIFAVYFLVKFKQPYYKGMAYPFIALGLLFLIICCAVFLRSPKDIVRVNTMLQSSSELLQKEELPRMEKVVKNFRVFIVIEIILIITGILFLFLSPKIFVRGIFTGLLIQAVFLILFDGIAQQRGKVYLEFLHKVTLNPTK